METPIFELARKALDEDRVLEDVTTSSLEEFLKSRGESWGESHSFCVIAKEPGIFSGVEWVESLCQLMEFELERVISEGRVFERGAELCRARGAPGRVLSAERTLLNGLQFACGVATQTRTYVERLRDVARRFEGNHRIPALYHTRKTPPGLRALALRAVEAGGGARHRQDLADRVLFKENHKYWLERTGFSLGDYVRYLRTWGFEEDIIEVENMDEALECVEAGAQHLLLDNFSPEEVREFLQTTSFSGEVEVSGGLNLESLEQYCLPGVTRLSVGALTRDVKSLDLSLDWAGSM